MQIKNKYILNLLFSTKCTTIAENQKQPEKTEERQIVFGPNPYTLDEGHVGTITTEVKDPETNKCLF